MSNYDYEHGISPNDPTVVQVRSKYPGLRKPTIWGIYMRCRDVEDAERILRMLQHPEKCEVTRRA